MAHNSQDPQGYYEILELRPGASMTEIKDALSKKQREYHPNGMSARAKLKNCKTDAEKQKVRQEYEEKSKKVNEAKSVLLDEKKKQAYDSGMGDFDGAGFSGAGDFFDIFSRMTGGGGSRRNQVRKVKDIVYELVVSFKEAYTGKTSVLNVKVQRECKSCGGKGGDHVEKCKGCDGRGVRKESTMYGPLQMVSEVVCGDCKGVGQEIRGSRCSACKGNRYVETQERIELKLEQGVKHGQKFVFQGRGNHKSHHVPGDIIIVVSISKDHKFKRVGNNILAKADIPLYTALVGGCVYFDHVDGRKLEVFLKPYTNLKKCIVVKGEGFRSSGSSSCGDLYIDPNIIIDKNIDKELLARALRHNPGTNVYSGPKMVRQGEFGDLPSEEYDAHEHGQHQQEGYEEFFGGAASDMFSRMRFF